MTTTDRRRNAGPASAVIVIRVQPDAKARYQKYAAKAGMSLSAYILHRLDSK